MAQVDFSNAVLTPIGSLQYNTYTVASYGLMSNSFVSADSWTEISAPIKQVVTATPAKISINYTGSFNAAGTSFRIVDRANNRIYWLVSNISFQAGDTYNFTIDAEITVS